MSFLYFLHKSVSSGKYNNNSNKKCQQTEQNRQPSEWKERKKKLLWKSNIIFYTSAWPRIRRGDRGEWLNWTLSGCEWLTLRSVCVTISHYYHSNHFHAESDDTPRECTLGFSAAKNVCNSSLIRSYTASCRFRDQRHTGLKLSSGLGMADGRRQTKEWIPNREIEKARWKKDEMNITRHDTTCNEITPEIRWVFSFLLLITYFWGKIVIVKYKNHLHTHTASASATHIWWWW